MEKKIRRRRGVLYSLITLILVLPLIFFVIAYLQSSSSVDELSSLKIRGIEMSQFANSISEDVPRILRITSKRALISAVNEVDVNGTPLDDARLRIRELMLNGSVYGINSTFMNGSTMEAWAGRMRIVGMRYGFDTNITFLALDVVPFDSFNLEFSLLLLVNATDPDGQVAIVRTYNQSYVLPLEGIEDLYYPLSTNGFIKRDVRRATFPVEGDFAIDQAIEQELYMNTSEGGSYFDRMEGKGYIQQKYAALSPRQIGLESIVNLQDLGKVGIALRENQTAIDHLYFNSSTFDGCPSTNSSYGWLKLDAEHAAVYNASIAC